MKIKILLLVASLSLLGQHTLAQEWSASEVEAWKAVEGFYAAYQRGDVAEMMSFHHRDYLNWGYSRPMTRDRESLRKALDLWFGTRKAQTLQLDVKPVSIRVREGVAVVCYYTTETYRDADGKLDTASTRWMQVLVKESGKWLVFADHGGPVRLQ